MGLPRALHFTQSEQIFVNQIKTRKFMQNQILIGMSEPEFFEKTRQIFREVLHETRTATQQPENPLMRDFLTRDETAALLRVTLPTLRSWENSGLITAKRLGGRVLFSKSEILKKLEGEPLKFRRAAR